MRILLISSAVAFLSISSFSQAPQKINWPVYYGISAGWNQHGCGGGPTLELVVARTFLRFSAGLATQINTVTPYRIQTYGEYRYVNRTKEFFGGTMSFSFINKHVDVKYPIFPTAIYSATYFNTYFARDKKAENQYNFLYSQAPGFSTTQTLSAGFTMFVAKWLNMDLSAGAGVYIFRNYPTMGSVINPESISGQTRYTEIRPDINLKISFTYFFAPNEK